MMTFAKAATLAGLAGIVFSNFAGSAYAGELGNQTVFKPLAAVSFDASPRNGVAYFTSAAQHCKLVLTVAEAMDESASDFTVTRREVDLPAGSAVNYESSIGKALEFRCLSEAQEMSLKDVDQVVQKGLQ